ncbi:nuclear transport factor 2 family protein [Planomonospora algeriensis]
MSDSTAVIWEAPYGDHPARRAARSSMTAVAAGRREDWLGLFAPHALVEDPVGPSMLDPDGKGHRGRDGIGSFWDGHVASVRAFRFRVADSFANGPCCANVVSITMTLDGGAVMTVDCVIVYTVDASGLITSLRAHWEPDRALATLTAP